MDYNEIRADVERMIKILNDDARRYESHAMEAQKHDDPQGHQDFAYWRGKQIGVMHAISGMKDLLYNWEDKKEQELEEQASERSEKDCMWEDRE